MRAIEANRRERIDGLATFAAVAFALAVAMIATLERVGAPDAFVEGLGPLFAFAALSFIGLANRAAHLIDFLAARRIAPPLYGGLSLMATVVGLGLTRQSAGVVAFAPLALGLAAASLGLAPALRAANVSAPIDALATRFPAWPLRVGFGLTLFAVGALAAIAGFDLAERSLAAAVGANSGAAVAFVIFALCFTGLPGGARSAIWTDAASGGGALMIVVSAAALALALTANPLAPLDRGLAHIADELAAEARSPSGLIALTAALAVFPPLTLPALAARSPAEARLMGVSGIGLALIALVGAALALPLVGLAQGSAEHTANALLAAATFLPTLTLARGGVLTASRSLGLDLTRAYSRLTVLSSRRIALNRLAMLATIVLCPLALRFSGLTPNRALTLALALSLAFVAPSLMLALTLKKRGASLSAAVALAGAATTALLRWKFAAAGFAGEGLLIEALLAGSVGLLTGAAAALFAPDRVGAAKLPLTDPFAETPFDPVD